MDKQSAVQNLFAAAGFLRRVDSLLDEVLTRSYGLTQEELRDIANDLACSADHRKAAIESLTELADEKA